MVSVDIFVIIQDTDLDVIEEETKVADIVMNNRFIGSTHIVFSSKGNFVGIRLLGCFPAVENIDAAFDQINSVPAYELIG